MSERPVVVHKFGGTSLGDAERIVRAARLMAAAARRNRVVGVASAMGGVTDVLLRSAHEAERGRLGPARKAVAELRADVGNVTAMRSVQIGRRTTERLLVTATLEQEVVAPSGLLVFSASLAAGGAWAHRRGRKVAAS